MSITDIVILEHMATTSSPLRRLLVEHTTAMAEIAKLRAEVETMRPVYVAALEWRASESIGGQRGHARLESAIDELEPANG